MRTPKTYYRNGILVKFSVKKKKIHYTSYLWIHKGDTKKKISSGIFNDNLAQIVDDARLEMFENPKDFGYDHDYWMSNKERLESQQNMPTEMIN